MGTPWWSRPEPGTGLDLTLRRLVVTFRLLGWAWMLILVIVTLSVDAKADQTVVIGAFVVATAWTVVTAVVAFRTDFLGSWWFVALDGVVALAVGSASTFAAAGQFFHGGFPMSWVIVAAYAGGRAAALGAAALLTVEQVVVHLIEDRDPVATAGSVIFFVFAFITGWTFDALRMSERQRAQAVDALQAERAEAARRDERVRLADQLHDTVLQTLHAIRVSPGGTDEVRSLARRHERELRKAMASLRSPHENSFRVLLMTARDEVESTYPVEIDLVVRGDCEVTGAIAVAVDSAREAMFNAAAHAQVPVVEVYSEADEGGLTIQVRDRGRGYDPTRLTPERGLGRCSDRLAMLGGSLAVVSDPGRGTECTIRVPT